MSADRPVDSVSNSDGEVVRVRITALLAGPAADELIETARRLGRTPQQVVDEGLDNVRRALLAREQQPN